jgi:hypothetical protein
MTPSVVIVLGQNTGGPNTGAGCCDISAGVPGPTCTPGQTTGNCVPCCNGFPLPTNAALGCCTPGTTSTC